MSETIKPGRYRHFKGKEYEVLYIATHSETREEMVVYRALYGERGVWVRPASMWNEVIERDGKTYRRFTYIGEGDAWQAHRNMLCYSCFHEGSHRTRMPGFLHGIFLLGGFFSWQ